MHTLHLLPLLVIVFVFIVVVIIMTIFFSRCLFLSSLVSPVTKQLGESLPNILDKPSLNYRFQNIHLTKIILISSFWWHRDQGKEKRYDRAELRRWPVRCLMLFNKLPFQGQIYSHTCIPQERCLLSVGSKVLVTYTCIYSFSNSFPI